MYRTILAFLFVLSVLVIAAFHRSLRSPREGLIGDQGSEEGSAIIVGDAYNKGEGYYLCWPIGAALLALMTTLLAAGVMFCTLQRIGRKICRILGVKIVIR